MDRLKVDGGRTRQCALDSQSIPSTPQKHTEKREDFHQTDIRKYTNRLSLSRYEEYTLDSFLALIGGVMDTQSVSGSDPVPSW